MDDNKKSYYSVIPANIRYDKRLTPNAKLLYGEITALCNEKGYCWATNDYFAELYGVSKKSISNWISQLNYLNYIDIEIEYKKGSKEIFHRYIRLFPYPMEEKVNTPMEEKVKENNTSINTTFNTTSNKQQQGYETVINTYTDNELLRNAILDFIKMRKAIKKPMTDRALTLLLNKLNSLANTDDEKIEILNQSIMNSWQGVFPLKQQNANYKNNVQAGMDLVKKYEEEEGGNVWKP